MRINPLAELSLSNRRFYKIECIRRISATTHFFHVGMAKISNGTQEDKVRAESAVRAAALAAAKGAPLSEAFLSKIVAETSDPSLTVADRVLRASTLAEQYVTSPKAINTLSATPQEIAAQVAAMNFASSRIAGSASQLGDGGRASGKGGYQSLGNSDPRGLQNVTSASFAGSSFAAAGLDFGTLLYVRSQDRTFTAQNVLNAANDTKALGFNPNDRGAMLDHTIIDRYDPKARTTNRAMQEYQSRIEGDDDLCNLYDKARRATTTQQRKEINGQIVQKRMQHAKDTGLTERIADPHNPAKSVAATKRRKTSIEKKAEGNYDVRLKHNQSASAERSKPTKADADLFKKLTSSAPK